MEEGSSLPVTDPANRGKSRRRKQLTILIACVLIATVLWFLRAFENEYTTRVDHPVVYTHMPEKMIILNTLPQRISLQVKGLGFSVLWHNWNFSKTPLTIDVRKLRSVAAKSKKGFVEYLPMDQYIGDFSAQLRDLKILAIDPDTLMFRFAARKTKTIKVVPAFLYESGSSFIPDSLVRVSPLTIEVEGPDLLIDTLRFIRTEPIKINRQRDDFSRSLDLEVPDKLIKVNPEKVIVSVGKNF